ncbi:hypothetical protein PPYR_04276 [Photinus pyralis]|uniref:Peptidase S1 domain-containing protein n=1 Tax=Photinus pyralis TaxID=7054 RepID=A0A5N4AY43_PHOPY|nr:hypothetical protein PPYR_04276 [Photinus pyralis]
MSDRQIRVVGGNVTKENEFPWLAGMAKNGEFHCGGTLITRKHVLTAAHCVDGINYRTISIAFGDHDRKDKERFSKIQVRKIKKVVPHKLFDRSTYNNDIAILELDHPLHFDSKIQPACLPHSGSDDPAGKLGTVIGWGRTMEGGMLPGIVQEVQVPILTLQQCRAMKYRASRITTFMLCAGKGSMDSCQGDSGGPLVVPNGEKYEIVGIVSWGIGCARPGYPGVYTRVGKYISWIRSNVQDSCLCS